MVKTENAPGEGEQEQSGAQLEETQGCWRRWQLGCIRGPTQGGEGGFLPATHLAALPVLSLGVGGGGRPVTRCPLGTDSVTESLLDTGSPGGTGASPLGLEDRPAQSHALGKQPRGQPQIIRVHLAPRWRGVAGHPAFPGWGVVLPETPAGDGRSVAPSFPHLEATPGSPCPFSLPKKPFTTPPVWVGVSGPSLTCGCWSHQHSEGQSQGQVEGWKRDPGTPAHRGGGLGSGNLRGAESGAWSLDARVFELRELARAGAPGRPAAYLTPGRGRRRPALQFHAGALPAAPPPPAVLKGPCRFSSPSRVRGSLQLGQTQAPA